MAKPKHTILTEDGVITQDALLAYSQGRLSAEETVQMEKLLKDDPFAQDALEGMRSSPAPAEMKSVVTSLNMKLREKTGAREKKSKGIEIHWATYAYAAMILGVLIGLGFVMVHFIAEKEQNLALNKTVPQAQESAPVQEEKQQTAQVRDTITKPATTEQANAADRVMMDSMSLALPPVAANGQSGSGVANAPAADQSKKDMAQTISPTTQAERKVPAAAAPAQASIATKTELKTDKPAKANAGRLDDDYKVTVDGHDLETGKEDKAYYNNPSAKNLETVSISSAKYRKKEAEAEKAVASPLDEVKAARALFDASDFKEAGKKYSKILSDQPDNADALYFGGICDYHNGKNKQAEKNFDKLLKASLYVDGSKWYKAQVLIERGKKDDAKQLLRDLINTNSSFKDRAVKKYEEIVK